jgi:hypothetical protein
MQELAHYLKHTWLTDLRFLFETFLKAVNIQRNAESNYLYLQYEYLGSSSFVSTSAVEEYHSTLVD